MASNMNFRGYDDIFYRQHYTSKTHPRMPRINRAAQFAPFSALTGYEESIKETARLTDHRIELSEYDIEELNAQFNFILEHIKERPKVTVTYFKPDGRKKGGEYITVTGKVRKLDLVNKTLFFEDEKNINIMDIVEIE